MDKTIAVLLVAGDGKRLQPFTNTKPKCFVEVNGIKIIENALMALSNCGCEKVRIVVGHFADLIRKEFGLQYKKMEIDYVENFDFQITNSMYSLSLGLKGIVSPTWVIEGDVFFDSMILSTAVTADIGWFVDSSLRHLDGAYITFDNQNRAYSLEIVKDASKLNQAQCKSIGMLKLSKKGVDLFSKWLEEGIKQGKKNIYYDLILSEHFQELFVEKIDITGCKWFEIDNNDDLREAQRRFI